MARLNSLKATWEEYRGWIFLAFGLYVLYCFKDFFSALGSGAGALAQGATKGIVANAEQSANNSKVKASTGATKDYTPDQLNQFAADAQTLATMFGRGPVSLESVFKDLPGAFTMLKQKYSRLNLYNNKPYILKKVAGKNIIISQAAETKDSHKNIVNWKALKPFYKEFSGGHDLEADIRFYLTSTAQKAYLKWIL